MNKTLIGIIGEFNHNSISQAAINSSLDELRKLFNFDYKWIDTETAANTSEISGLSGIWSASGSPFKNIDGALNAIKHARINNIPHLGTCG
ncbi:MAG: hypothetical protein KAZ87_01320, partial [Spirochaetes bacterium]|nr:hypothetical protein [Spirochaetota bacterium]